MEPEIIMLVALMSFAGASVGMFSGLVPGIHVNTLISVMLIVYPAIGSLISVFAPPGNVPVLLASCIVSAAVVHSFVNYVPSVFTGVPDQDTAMSVLPGHRLLLEGKGMVAVRASAIGSLIGAMAAVAVALPLQWLMSNGLNEIFNSITAVMLIVSVIALVLTERTAKERCFAVILITMSGVLGCVCMFMPVPFSGLLFDGDLLLPLLSGLFGIPMLITSSGGAEIPAQNDDDIHPVTPAAGLKGVAAGSIVGWFPGITATAGAAFTRMFVNEDRPERFIALVSSIGTASVIFAMITLSVNGKGRSGTMIAVRQILGADIMGFGNGIFLLMLLSVAIAAAIGYVAAVRSGKMMAKYISKVNIRKMNAMIAVFIAVLCLLMTGIWGIAILLVSSLVGLIPLSAGTGRVHLSGCLLIPVVLMRFGLDVVFLSLF